jgi:hypothetical protein
MTRIFVTLAVFASLGLAATFALGTVSLFLDFSDLKKEIFLIHFTLGLFTAIGLLLLHCLIFTYFLGTGRWVKEVGLAYDLPDHQLPRTTRELKRSTFPPALFAMLSAIATVAAGAGAHLEVWPWYVHGSLAVLTLLINAWAFRIDYGNLNHNVRVIDAVMDEVERIRAAFGLTSNVEGLQECGGQDSSIAPLSPVLGGEELGVRGLACRFAKRKPDPSPPSTGERGEDG